METSINNVISIASYLRDKSSSSTSDDHASPRPRPTTTAPRRPRKSYAQVFAEQE